MKTLLPEGWARPKGYSNGLAARGEMVFVAGMVGWDENEVFADGFAAQFAQVLRNTLAVLAEAGAGPEHMVRMTWYIRDMDLYRENLKAVGQAYREIIGKHYPTMAAVGVTELVEPQALIEIETTAVIPDG